MNIPERRRRLWAVAMAVLAYAAVNLACVGGSGKGGSGGSDSGGSSDSDVPAPASLVASITGSTRVVLSWDHSLKNVTGFEIERSADAGGTAASWSLVGSIGPAAAYTDLTINPGTDYWYRVRAVRSGSFSAYSNTALASVPPSTPTNLSATVTSETSVSLAWNHDLLNVDGFRIERAPGVGEAPGTYAQIATTGPALGYADTGLTAGTSYWYRVRAYHGTATTDPSNAVMVQTWTWATITTLNAPAGRFGHTAVWAGFEMIVWGGSDGAGELSTGARYDPSTNTWTAMATAGAPEVRQGHTAVWTDLIMVVWGGSNAANGFLASGGRFTPATDSWLPTNPTMAPSARSLHTATWSTVSMGVSPTMIVWGGRGLAGPVGTGARYNASADQWTPTATEPAPAARDRHTAVWAQLSTPSLVVWGGRDAAGQPLNDGGRYDAQSNTWTLIPSAGAPAGRYDHTAVWANDRMIVWGGRGAGGVLGDGSMFDVGSGLWFASSATGAPAARELHTAIWTNERMVVWGGFDGAADLGTGARFDPLTNTWEALTSAGAPSARHLHTAVWTTTRMMIWGGQGEGAPLGDGKSIDPMSD